ncbi:MAG: RNA methyltransferase [Coprococcus sp.]|nr:RNA methyltransferase [Coprococcus sp.]
MIGSTGNKKIKQLAGWQKKRKQRDADSVFVVEGLRMFEEAPRQMVEAVYVSESFFKQKKEELKLKESWGEKLEILTDTVFDYVSDTRTPQGVLLVMRKMHYKAEDIILSGKLQKVSGKTPLLMVLENLQDPGNLGTILRAGEAAGVTGILMSKDCADIYNPKVVRSTMGSIFRIPFSHVEDVPETVKELEKNGIRTYAAYLEGGGSYERENYLPGSAFVIGNEGNGLKEDTLAAVKHYVKIPMLGKVESLNAAMAATVLMFEAARQRRNNRKDTHL